MCGSAHLPTPGGCDAALASKQESTSMDRTKEVSQQKKPPKPITRTRCYSEGADISTLKDHLVSPTLLKEKHEVHPISTDISGALIHLICTLPFGG